MYGTLQVLGPEHEFSVVDEKLMPLPIVDRVIKDLHGRIVNTVRLKEFSFGKELQAHVAEFKANTPFKSPIVFEETMNKAVLNVCDLLERRYHAHLLGLGMHPSLQLGDVHVWSHRDRQLYEIFSRIFNLNQHGWLNIQSFQLNLPFGDEKEAIKLYNALANILPYLPAITASSPVYENKIGDYVDNRLHFYLMNQKEIPSITGDIIPEYVASFDEYEKTTIKRYSEDLARMNAPRCLLNKEWLNSRGAVIRFDKRAIEIRVMDEQECVKSDVALSCFVRALLRGFLENNETCIYLPHKVLVDNLHEVIKRGLAAKVLHPKGSTAKHVCRFLYRMAWKNADEEEKRYLSFVKQRIEKGSLSNLIAKEINKKVKKTSLEEAILAVYSSLTMNLEENKIWT
jgi:gamma-glutamyl:cysteine ligase YbdK (ATP-grasp superfamily)